MADGCAMVPLDVQVGRLTHAALGGWFRLLVAVGLGLGSLAGCGPDLGACDDALAHTLVYDATGKPHYAGQAMVQEACAGSFCHSANAKKDARLGAPAELDFDVPVVDGSASADTQAAQLSLLGAGHATVNEWLEEMWGQVDDGYMPPDGVGERPKLSWSESDGSGGAMPASEDTVPSVRSKDGKELLRNWLACGAPVVAGTPGVNEEVAALGDVVDMASNVSGPEANWESIHAKVIVPQCTACHTPTAMTAWPDTNLDLTAGANGASDVLPRLVGKAPFSGGPCDAMGTLIVAGDCANSIFFQKLKPADGGSVTCGSRMPFGGIALTDPTLQAICDWIDAGALP